MCAISSGRVAVHRKHDLPKIWKVASFRKGGLAGFFNLLISHNTHISVLARVGMPGT